MLYSQSIITRNFKFIWREKIRLSQVGVFWIVPLLPVVFGVKGIIWWAYVIISLMTLLFSIIGTISLSKEFDMSFVKILIISTAVGLLYLVVAVLIFLVFAKSIIPLLVP